MAAAPDPSPNPDAPPPASSAPACVGCAFALCVLFGVPAVCLVLQWRGVAVPSWVLWADLGVFFVLMALGALAGRSGPK